MAGVSGPVPLASGSAQCCPNASQTPLIRVKLTGMSPLRAPAKIAAPLALLLVLAGAGGVAAPAAAAPPGPAGVRLNLGGADSALLTERQVPVAPGLDLTSFQRLQPGGWVTGHVMTADLTTPSLSLDLADGGTVSGSNQTTSAFAATKGNVVAAVNGDYYDMNASDAPVGTNVSREGLRTAGSTPREAFTLVGGKAVIQQLMARASVTVGGRTITVGAVNSPTTGPNTVGLFTSVWGSYPLARLVTDTEQVRVVRIRDGHVTAISSDRSTITAAAPIPAGESVLLARGGAGVQFDGITVGTPAELTVGTSAEVDLAVGGSQRLVADGIVTTADEVTAGRTAIGVSRDGSRLWVVSIDGRQGDSHGMTIQELARLMADLGAYNAVNLDGGGSTTLVARPAGTTDLTLIDRPSDGHERLVSNALVFRSTATSGYGGVAARSGLQPAAGLTDAGATQLLPGLTRTVEGRVLDPNFAATDRAGRFTVPARNVVKPVELTGTRAVVRGAATGAADIRYGDGRTTATVPLVVHGPMQRLVASSTLLSLPSAQATGNIRLTAIDGDGYAVPVETRDVRVEVSGGVSVAPSGLASFIVTPTQDKATATITFRVLDRSVTVPVTVGFTEVPLADFADAGRWTFAADRATGSVAAVDGPGGRAGLGLTFDFATSTATRGAYAVPPAPIAVPGQPQALALWIKGNGKGEWPRLQVTRGDGTVTNLDPEGNALVDWSGWRLVRFPVPAGTAFPLTLTRIRFMETRSDATYTDALAIAGLSAQVPLAVEVPETPWPHDPAVVTNGTVAGAPQRIAVISDTQFVARNPDSDLVRAGRRTLREIVAARPDLLVVNGDFVDEASPADIALAKRVLDEEVGTAVPWIYVPGNHEIMGGPISNFAAVFGATATHRTLVLPGQSGLGTAVITLDSSTGTLHPGGSTAQLRMLEQQLAAAAANPQVTGVVVFNHHPVDDPHPDKASQLGDRYEAAALARTLADFTARTGKAVAQVNGHVGTFFTDAQGGVTRTINGNSGKSPSGTAERGGFTGWSMLGIQPRRGLVGPVPQPGARLAWLQVETHARVDQLSLSGPGPLGVGGSAPLVATLVQDGGRRVPVAWPVSAQWGGEGVVVGGGAAGAAVVRYDPDTGRLTGLRSGTATVRVTVNGVSAETVVRVG